MRRNWFEIFFLFVVCLLVILTLYPVADVCGRAWYRLVVEFWAHLIR